MTQRLFAMYVLIGSTVFVSYLGLFSFFVAHRWPLLLCSTVAYFTATALHFTLNRYANFRRFDRAIHDQARTFAAVILGQWVVTLVVVKLATAYGFAPLVGTVAAVIVNLPVGFVANRYLTFGAGIAPTIARLRNAQK